MVYHSFFVHRNLLKVKNMYFPRIEFFVTFLHSHIRSTQILAWFIFFHWIYASSTVLLAYLVPINSMSDGFKSISWKKSLNSIVWYEMLDSWIARTDWFWLANKIAITPSGWFLYLKTFTIAISQANLVDETSTCNTFHWVSNTKRNHASTVRRIFLGQW